MGVPSIASLLNQLREQSGALSVAWTGASGRTDVPHLGGAPWDAGLGRDDGVVHRLGRSASARVPRLVALGAHFAAVRRTDGPGGPRRLALAARAGLSLSDEAIEALFTALLALEEERAQKERARQRTVLASLGRAAGSAAHDLRNLMSAALLELDALEAGSREAEAGLRRSVSGARDLARDFLELEDAPERRAVELLALLEREAGRQRAGAVELLAPEAVPGAAQAGELWVAGRRDLITRVLVNLLDNAVAASPRGASVEVRACRVHQAVELTITDRGRGMDQVRLNRYLEPGETRVGSGFGTASVLHCLARVGGELWIESAPAEGTRCTVSLQAAPPPGAATALVHDPDPVARWSWREVFERVGWAALDTADAAEAEAWLASGELVLALTPRAARGSAQVARRARDQGVRLVRTGVASTSTEVELPRVADRSSSELIERLVAQRSDQ